MTECGSLRELRLRLIRLIARLRLSGGTLARHAERVFLYTAPCEFLFADRNS
jgi:hypothetical protein